MTSLAQCVLHQLPEGCLGEVVVGQLGGTDTVIRAFSRRRDRKTLAAHILAPDV